MSNERITGLKSPTGNIITPAGRLCYPNLFQKTLPQGETDQSKARFQTSMVFPKTADMKLLSAMVEEAAEGAWPKYKEKKIKVKKPFLRTEDSPRIGVDPEAFPVLIRCNTPSKPQVIRHDKSNVTEAEADEVYAGRWARSSLRAYTYDHPTGGKGVAFGLQNVQLLQHDEPLGAMRPAAEDEFEAAEIEGGDGAKSADSLFD